MGFWAPWQIDARPWRLEGLGESRGTRERVPARTAANYRAAKMLCEQSRRAFETDSEATGRKHRESQMVQLAGEA